MDRRECCDATLGNKGKQKQGTATFKADYKSRARQEINAATSLAEGNWCAVKNGEHECKEEGSRFIAQTQTISSRPNSNVCSTRLKVRRTSSCTNAMQNDGSFNKSSLNFILDDYAASPVVGSGRLTRDCTRAAPSIARSMSTGDLNDDTRVDIASSTNAGLATTAQCGRSDQASGQQIDTGGKRRARRPPSRICKHEGCEQYVVDQGLCVRHGGGKRCQTAGCTSRAKHQGRCWKHGGSTECKVPSCINRAKSRGFCWSHGGGTKCRTKNCEKIAISNALCWAHGGGKRCVVEDCMRQAYERTNNLCTNHYQEQQRSVAGGRADTVVDRSQSSRDD